MSDDWTTWAAEWRSAPASLPHVADRARKETRSQARGFAIEALASLAVIVFYAVVLADGAPAPVVAVAVASCAFVVIWMANLVRTFRGQWRAEAETTCSFLELSLGRRRARLRWLSFVRWCLVAFGVFVLGWGPWMLHAGWAVYSSEPWRAFVGFGGIAAILAGIDVWLDETAGRSSASSASSRPCSGTCPDLSSAYSRARVTAPRICVSRRCRSRPSGPRLQR